MSDKKFEIDDDSIIKILEVVKDMADDDGLEVFSMAQELVSIWFRAKKQSDD